MRILLEIEYKGTNYCGWQSQKNGVSIQETLQNVMSDFFKEKIVLFASGRTDAGVHAKSQFAHFDLNKKFDINKIPFALQNLLPSDISIKSAKETSNDFHARYSVKNKTYHYQMYVSKIRLPLKDETFLQVKQNLNIEKIKQACKYFVGEHNFKAFCIPRKLDNENFVRNVLSCEIETVNNDIIFKITGEGFLHNMVRIIVGTMIDVGQEKIQPEEVKNIILSQDRAKAGKTVSPRGLILYDVQYNS